MLRGKYGGAIVMNPKSVVEAFIESLDRALHPNSTLAVELSNFHAFEFGAADKVVHGPNWACEIDPSEIFDFIVVDLPLGMGRTKVKIGDATISVRKNWIELLKALRFLNQGGTCIALVEPPAFGIGEGPKFLEALKVEGYMLNGIFNVPQNLLSTTSIRPVLVALSRDEGSGLFVAELEQEAQAAAVSHAFVGGVVSESLVEGILLEDGKFDGFESLKARIQLDRLETQYKEYKGYTLGDLAEEMISVRSGEKLTHKENSIYVPMLGSSVVAHDLPSVTIKHHNVVQVVLSDRAKSEYVAAFFQSDLGLLILRSLTRGAVIPKITKSELVKAQVALPNLKEQDEIIHSHNQLHELAFAIATFQKELALNPRSASAIRGQVENMLEQIGSLTDVDRIMSMAREGESATVEFKETFGLDVKKGTKEKYIELSALKTVVAFLNTAGGVLLVGVTDGGDICGIQDEVKKLHKNSDAYLLHIKNQLKNRVGEQYYPFIDHRLVDLGSTKVLMVSCRPASAPCYLDGKDFYVRTNPATDKLEGPKLVEYVQNHFNRRGFI
jgi:hypothetical protein